MNLIQIQDKLKSLPNDPRVMQMLTAYANGQNPQVPPYLALGELNRRKVLMEEQQAASAGQPPGGTVKDQIQQQTGVMALQQGRQQQAMQQMARQAAAGVPVPQGIAQPQPQAQAMAAGGLASLRPGYRSGGIVAFSGGDLVPSPERVEYERLMREAEEERKKGPPAREDYFARQARLIKENPEMLGALARPIGQDALARLEDLQAARRAELEKQKEELAGSKPGILQLLGQAAMKSQGQKGMSALASILGGYSELSSGASAKQLQQEQALRMKELDLQQAKADVLNKVEEARRAYAAGNMDKAEAYMKEGEDIAAKHGVSMTNLLGKQVSAASQQVVSKDATTQAILDRDQRRLDERLNRESRERTARLTRADRPFNPIEVQYNLLKTNDPKENAALLQRLIKENSEVKKPGLDETKLNAFMRANDAPLTQLRRDKLLAKQNPQKYSQQYETALRTLRQAAENRGLDPDSIPDLVAGGATPVESPGAPPPGAVREVKK